MNALEIQALHKVYANGFVALKGIDLVVNQGDFFGLLGPNGAGKSTTIGIITSLVNKTSGQVKVHGFDIDQHFSSAKACIGVVPQEFNFSIFQTVLDIVVDQAGYYGIARGEAKKRAEKYLKLLSLWDKRHTISRNLSGGMKRRLMIARALVHEPKLLILDEPTAGVDIEVRRSMWNFLSDLNAEGITIILTTHYLEEAEFLCKNIAIIDQGRVIKNTTKQELLLQLDQESFLLDLKSPCQTLPDLAGYTLNLLNPLLLEVETNKNAPIGALIAALENHAIHVVSLRNKANRLEELFLHLTQKG